eukprot:augustus_masked-scaffold_2-processed-gene-22.41-mRNA-1 protein AED:1.00 eAED:1.00 QI:0/-1/0/0/-1/1/1/0/547
MKFKTRRNSKAVETEDKSFGYGDVLEEHELFVCDVNQTKIPKWLEGTLYKQCGGAFGGGYNFLDGLAHVVAFKFENQSVFFSNRILQTQSYADFVNSGERNWGITAVDARMGAKAVTKEALKKFVSFIYDHKEFKTSEVQYKGSNPNVTFWVFDQGESIAGVTEGDGEICVFEKDTLQTLPSVKSMKVTKKPLLGRSMIITNCSHFFREGSKGGYHVAVEMEVSVKPGSLSMVPFFTFYYNIYFGDSMPMKLVYQSKIASFQYHKKEKFNLIPSLRPSFMHTTAKSEHFLVLILSSFRWDYEKLLKIDFSDGVFGMFPRTEENIEFIILKSHENGDLDFVGKFQTEVNAMAFHVANCYEQQNNSGETEVILETTLTSDFRDPYASSYERFTINLNTGTVVDKVLYENFSQLKSKYQQWELININPKYHQRKHQYVYGLGDPFEPSSTISKLDVETEKFASCTELENRSLFPSEPIFVPNPTGSKEDDGVILTVVSDQNNLETYLCIIDATDMTVSARIKAPTFCNFGLHSVYLPSSRLVNNKLVSKL